MLFTKDSTGFHFILTTFVVVSSLSIISCSKTPDVRLTMCQDLMMTFSNAPEDIVWQEHKPIFRGYNDLEMQVSYSHGQTENKASCFYAHIENEDAMGAEEFNTPTVAYSTYPHKMILNGQVVDKMKLANGVNTVMLKQGGKVITKAKEKVEEGVEIINQEVKKQLEK